MSTYSQSIQTIPASETIDLPVSAWAHSWPSIPRQTVKVGLRLLSSHDYVTARAIADEKVSALHSSFSVDSYNDALMAYAVARGTCDPHNVAESWLEAAEDNITMALTADGIRFLWDALERYRVANSPLIEPWDGELEGLSKLPEAKQVTCRKLLAYVYEMIADG